MILFLSSDEVVNYYNSNFLVFGDLTGLISDTHRERAMLDQKTYFKNPPQFVQCLVYATSTLKVTEIVQVLQVLVFSYSAAHL